MAIGVALLGASRLLAQTYLLNEGFEGAGYENPGWTAFGASDPDHAANPLAGAHSLRCSGVSSFIQRPFARTDDFYSYFQVRWTALAPYKYVVDWLEADSTSITRVITDGFPNRLQIVHGSVSVSGTTILTANLTYHVWAEWTRGTGDNGTMRLFVSTNGVKPASPEAAIATGTGNRAIAKFDVGPFDGAATTDVMYDRILLDDEPIGSNPGGNSPPAISSISDQRTPESTALGPIDFTFGDAETNASALLLTGTSSNTNVVPNANIVFGGSGSNRTVTITPTPGVAAHTLITIAVSDGQASASTSFNLAVGNANRPAIYGIPNQSTSTNTAIGPIPVTIGDVETPAASLTLSGASTNTTLVPDASIVFGGSGPNRTVTLTPAPDQSGVTLITVFVSDGQLTNSASFTLTVNAANTPPLISDLPNRTTPQDTTLGPIDFTIGDAEIPATSLSVTRSSSNPGLLPPGGIALAGSGSNRTVTLTPAAGQTGSATVTLTISDGDLTASDSFVLTVTATNPPTSNPGEWLLREGFEGAGYENTDWTELISPNPDYSTLALKGDESLNLGNGSVIMRTFQPTNEYSLYCRLRWNRLAKNAILYYFETADYSPAASLMTDYSANRLLLTHGGSSASGATDLQPNVTYHVWMEWTLGTGGNGTLKLFLSTDVIRPVLPEASVTTGTGGLIERLYMGSIDTVPDVIVDSILIANEPIGDNPDGNARPTISNIAGQAIDEDSSTGPVSFAVGDRETAATSLTLSGASSNQTLVPDSNIVFGGSGSNCTVIVTPLRDQFGTAEISVTVSDGSLSANGTFVLTVHPMPDDPGLTWLNPDPIAYGVPLSSTQLNAVANVPGLFTYTPPGGTILNASAGQTLAVTFTPDDPVNYNSFSANVTISVTRAALLVSANSTNRPYGTANPPFTASYAGLVNGDDETDLDSPVALSTSATAASPADRHAITAANAADLNYAITFVDGTLTVTPAGPLTLALIIVDAVGNATLRITSDPGQRIKVQASANLIDWIDIATLENATGAIDHLDLSEPGRTCHFYRAMLAPK